MATPSTLTHSLIPLIDCGSIIAVVVGVAKAFEWFDGMVSDPGRQALSNQLKNVPSDERIDSWAAVFPRLVDRIFGPRPLTLGFFARSCLASCLAVAVLTFIGARYFYYELKNIAPPLTGLLTREYWLLVPLAAIIANFVPDYISLLVSRVVVRLMARSHKAKAIALLLLVDTLLTYLVATISASIATITLSLVEAAMSMQRLANLWGGPFIRERVTLWSALYSLFTDSDSWLMALRELRSDDWLHVSNDLRISIIFYGAFFTSVWVWLYLLSIIVVKLLHSARAIWVRIAPYLDIEKKPLVAIGKVAGLLAGAGYAVILGFIWIGRHWR